MKIMPAAQVAFSVLDLERTVAWWRDVFGLAPAGGSSELTGPEAARAQGLPASESRILWLVDQQDFFQLEFFRFTEPEPRPLRDDWRPSDIGYSLVGVHVQDFDATLERAALAGSDPVGPLREQPGARRAAVQDPEGAIVEIMEDDPRAPVEGHRVRPDIPCACRYIRATVSDLQASHAFFVDTLGCKPADSDLLHGDEDEAMWGLANAQVQRAAVWSGDFVIEFATYTQPESRSWPEGYLLSDQGPLNIALASREPQDYRDVRDRVVANGYHANPEMAVGPAAVSYVNDDQGFSVELLTIPDPAMEGMFGWLPENGTTAAPAARAKGDTA